MPFSDEYIASAPDSRPASRRCTLSRALPWAGVGSLLAVLLRPLWGLPVQGDDALLHYFRIAEVNALLQRGILFSRWAPDLVFGYGYPLFHFYPPLSAYLLTAAYWLAGQNAQVGTNLVYGLTLCLACVGMYLLGRELWGRAGGLISAAGYALSPQLLLQTFRRSSISDALAMGIFPLAALALVRAARRPTLGRSAWAALLLAAVLLSHLSAGLLFAAPCAILGAAVALRTEDKGQSPAVRLGAVLLSVAGGLALSAFVWLPALAEVGFTRYAAAIASPGVDFHQYFAGLIAWPEARLAGSLNADLPANAGLAQLALACTALGPALAALVAGGGRQRRLRRELPAVSAALMGFAAVFLAVPASTPVWEHVSLLRNLQFPWRCLDAAAFLLPLAGGRLAADAGAGSSSPSGWRTQLCRWWRIGLVVAGLTVAFANAVPYTYPALSHSLPAKPTLADVTATQQRFGVYGLTSWGEYAPATMADWPAEPSFPGADQGANLDAKLQRDALPAGTSLTSNGGPLDASFQLDLPAAAPLTLETFYFPGWRAWVDGQPVSAGPDDQGRLSVPVPAGEHTVEVRFGRTPVESVADLLSAGALALAALALGAAAIRHLHRRTRASGSAPSAQRSPAGLHLLAASGALLVILAVAKFAWLDRFDSPLVYYLHGNTSSRLTAAAWGDYGDLRLAGYRLDDSGQLTLYWQVERPPQTDYQVQVTLADTRGVPVQSLTRANPGHSESSYWEAGDIVRDEYTLPLDEAQRPIVYNVSVGLIDPSSGLKVPAQDAPTAALDVPLGTIRLAAPEQTAPQDAAPVHAVFGGAIELTQAEIPQVIQAGASLNLELYWRSLRPVQTDYTVFVHLLKADDTLAAGNDSQPRDGLYPTSDWVRGELIADERAWQPEVPPGEYQIEVGLYDLRTGQRLPVSLDGVPAGDRVLLGTIRVAG